MLAREGCDVAGLDLAASGAAVRETGREALELKADITDLDATLSAVDEVTRAWGGVDTPEQREALLGQIPTRTLGRPEDLAESIVHFCLPSAAYLTGVILPQDGGHAI